MHLKCVVTFSHVGPPEEICLTHINPSIQQIPKTRFFFGFQGRKIRNPPAGYPPDIRKIPDIRRISGIFRISDFPALDYQLFDTISVGIGKQYFIFDL